MNVMRLLTFILLTGCIGQSILPSETGAVSAFFCDKTNCFELLKNLTKDGDLNCAMYHTSKAQAEWVQSKGSLIVDEEHGVKGAIVETGSGLMHDKFCIINKSIVWTGSWNPSQEQTIANNVILIESKILAKAYIDEFEELKRGVFHGGKSGQGRVVLNGHLTEALFCPEDSCQKRVIEVLNSAKESIHFMTFSFTDNEIGALLAKKVKAGIDVKGVFDPRMDKYSEYERLKNISIVSKVHHKVFIIDNSTVITGSANPTGNGYTRNDENVLILRDERIAARFEEEFARIT